MINANLKVEVGNTLKEQPSPSDRRLNSSDDLEVSAYLEIAQENRGQSTVRNIKSIDYDEAIKTFLINTQSSFLIKTLVDALGLYKLNELNKKKIAKRMLDFQIVQSYMLQVQNVLC